MKKIKAYMIGDAIISNSAGTFTLYQKSSFGEKSGDRISYSLMEAFYLVEKNKLEIADSKNRFLGLEELRKKFQKIDKKFNLKYIVFRDLRDRGYVIKTALKFGAEFRVYPKGGKPGQKHSKWIVFSDYEGNSLTWHEFASKNRVAHSTRKNLLLAVVDEDSNITYYEVRWIRP